MSQVRKCWVCKTEVYEDEVGQYCQDCRGVLLNIHEAHFQSDVASDVEPSPPKVRRFSREDVRRVG